MSTTTPAVDLTPTEVLNSLTGFDEIAIRAAFPGIELYTGNDERGMDFIRALVFVVRRRAGDKDRDARTAALSLRLDELETYFADDVDQPEDGTEQEPFTTSGEDSAPSA